MDAYLIKNSISTGTIRKIRDAELVEGEAILVPLPSGSRRCFGRAAWAPTAEDARKRVEVLRLRKIKSLRAQIEKLENLQVVIKE